MAKKLKIGLVLDDSLDSVDGVQQYVLGIGEWLSGQGHEVHYLVGETSRRDIKNIHSLSRNIKVRFNGNRGTMPLPTSKKKLRQFLDQEKFDVLHVQVPYSPFMARSLVMAAGPKTAIIGTFHIAPYSRLVHIANGALGIWLKRSLKKFDRIVSVSEAAQDFARSTFRIGTDILPNVIDYNLFHNAKPLKQYSDKDTMNILFVGRLVPRKGCQLLLRAVARIKNELGTPGFRVIICGKGPQAGAMRQFIARNGLEDIVEMAGFISEKDKPLYYASADISVFPSSAGESFGIVLLEAMASGRAAVIAGDNPGYRSVLAPRPELLFDPHDAHGLADKLKQFLIDEALRKDARQWGESYTRQFDRAAVGNRLLGIYNQALRKRRLA